MTAITFSLKQTFPTDWEQPLRSFFKTVYGDTDEFDEEIVTLNKLRQNMMGAGKTDVGRDILYQYFAQLELLTPRIPISEHACQVKFKWRSLHGDETIAQHSISFEKAAVLFNLGAVLSNIGSQDPKQAYQSFQAAAGCFHLISTNFLHAPSVDLDQETAKTCAKLMLAQAEYAFYLKASESPAVKPLVLAKLAKAAATKFAECSTELEKLYKSEQWGSSVWSNQTKSQSQYLDGVADYQYALALDSKGKHGLALSHMKRAIATLGSVPPPYKDLAQGLLEVCKKEFSVLERDNDLIYNELIPPILEDVPSKDSAAPLPLEKMYGTPEACRRIVGEPLFQRVIPIEAHEKASVYSEEKAQLIRKEREALEVADEELKSALEYMDLPRSATILLSNEDEKELVKVPVIVADWATEVASSKIKTDFSFEQNHIMSLAQSALEGTDDARLRDIKLSIVKSRAKDEEMKTSLANVASELSLLGSGVTGQLAQKFAQLAPTKVEASTKSANLLELDDSNLFDGGLDPDCIHTIEGIQTAVKQLRDNAIDRKRIFTVLKEQLQKDDIRPLLVQYRGEKSYAEISAMALAKYQEHLKRLGHSIKSQREVINQITQDWMNVLSMPAIKKKVKCREQSLEARDTLVEQLRRAYQVWREAKDQSAGAARFYQQLESQVRSPMSSLEQSFRNLSAQNAPPPPPKRAL